jgi:hypothetical protein
MHIPLSRFTLLEVKFVVNDEFELRDKDNRRVLCDSGDTTVYRAIFNLEK